MDPGHGTGPKHWTHKIITDGNSKLMWCMYDFEILFLKMFMSVNLKGQT